MHFGKLSSIPYRHHLVCIFSNQKCPQTGPYVLQASKIVLDRESLVHRTNRPGYRYLLNM